MYGLHFRLTVTGLHSEGRGRSPAHRHPSPGTRGCGCCTLGHSPGPRGCGSSSRGRGRLIRPPWVSPFSEQENFQLFQIYFVCLQGEVSWRKDCNIKKKNNFNILFCLGPGSGFSWNNKHIIIVGKKSININTHALWKKLGRSLKGQCHEIFFFLFFLWISFPKAPEYTIRAVSNFFENSRRYSQLKVHHRYQQHRRQILPPVSLLLLILVANLPPVLTIPAANLPPVSTTPVANNGINIRLQIP